MSRRKGRTYCAVPPLKSGGTVWTVGFHVGGGTFCVLARCPESEARKLADTLEEHKP